MESSNGRHREPVLYNSAGTVIPPDAPGITSWSDLDPARQVAYRKIIQAMQLSYAFSCLPEYKKEQTGYSDLDFKELTDDVINRQAAVLEP